MDITARSPAPAPLVRDFDATIRPTFGMGMRFPILGGYARIMPFVMMMNQSYYLSDAFRDSYGDLPITIMMTLGLGIEVGSPR